MKKIQFFVMALLCLLHTQIINAQSDALNLNLDSNGTYIDGMDKMFEHIKKSNITTGIWYDRILPMANLDELTNKIKVSPSLYYQAYYELWQSSYYKTGKPAIDKISLLNSYYKNNDTLVLAIINSKFQKLKDSIVADSMLIFKNGQFYEGPQIAKAFETKQIIFGTLLTPKLMVGKKYTLNVGKILFENNSNKVKEVVFTYKKSRGDSTIIMNGNKPFVINEAGIYNATIQIKMVDGQIIDCDQVLEVTNGNSNGARLISQLTNSSCDPFPYTPLLPNIAVNGIVQANLAFNGILGQAEITVFPRTNLNNPLICENNILKPIIILDGIDDGDARKGHTTNADEGIYEDFLFYNNPAPQTTTIVERQIGDSLRLMGYDVIIFNPSIRINNNDTIDGGDDLIERNGLALVRLIQMINNDLDIQAQTTGVDREELVIAGPSMGGQVSRYALAFMEQQLNATNDPVWNHHCRLWLSLDSPHRGANIPIGLQQYFKFFATFSADARIRYEGNLRAPASRQQLIHQTSDNTPFISDVDMNNTSPERTAWMNTLNTLGYPMNCRKIELSNGSRMGGDFHPASSDMLAMQLGFASFMGAQLNLKSKFLPITGGTDTTFQGSILHLKLKWKWTGWNSGFQPVYINSFFSNCILTNTSTFGSIDACPGSLFNVQSTLKNAVDTGLVQLMQAHPFWSGAIGTISNFLTWPVFTQNISFIPTVSSLDYNTNLDWSQPIPDGLICGNQTPFDAYYLPDTNESHVFFTRDSWQWLKVELEKGHVGPDCGKICATKILGDAYTCVNVTNNYSLDVPLPTPTGVTVTWTGSAGLNVVQVGNEAQITATVGTPQLITATIYNPCGHNIVLTKLISVTPIPVITNPSIQKLTLGCQTHFSFLINGAAPPSTYTFSWSPNNGFYPPPSNVNTNHFQSSCWVKNNVDMYVKVYSPCGYIGTFNKSFLGNSASSCSCKKDESLGEIADNFNVDIYPNPSTDQWNVSVSDFVQAQKASCKLYNLDGKVVWSTEHDFENYSNIVVPAANLPKGIYILKIVSERQNGSYKLIKE
jgi:hypothetical protein